MVGVLPFSDNMEGNLGDAVSRAQPDAGRRSGVRELEGEVPFEADVTETSRAVDRQEEPTQGGSAFYDGGDTDASGIEAFGSVAKVGMPF